MSPPAFRATFPGVSYQLGNVCLSKNPLKFNLLIIHTDDLVGFSAN